MLLPVLMSQLKVLEHVASNDGATWASCVKILWLRIRYTHYSGAVIKGKAASR